jgi:ribosomal protein S2
MNIVEYLKKNKMRVVEFASKMKVTTFSVYRWLDGKMPRESQIEKIKELSDGQITETDWGNHVPRREKTLKRKASSINAKPDGSSGVESDENR